MIFTEDELSRLDKILRASLDGLPHSVTDAGKLGAELEAKYGRELRLQGLDEANEFFKDAHAEYKKQQDAAKWLKKNSRIR